ncbi:MAG: hypothetical protein WBX18_21000 [Terracidiphilus sp.]
MENRTRVEADAELGSMVDPMLEQALTNFRHSVHAWSETALSRPRTVALAARRRSWRLAAGWALWCVLAAGSLAGGLYERHHDQVVAKMKAEQEARQRQLALQQRAREEDEDLLATVDSDISRAVPAAMEPLAQLMDGDEGQ